MLIYERCEGNITSGTLHSEMARFLSKVSVKQYRGGSGGEMITNNSVMALC